MIDSLMPIKPVVPIGKSDYDISVSENTAPRGVFGSIFQSAIENVIATDAEKTELEYQLSVGELDNPALLTIASTKNQIAVDLLVQLRNKALDAYSELTRMSL